MCTGATPEAVVDPGVGSGRDPLPAQPVELRRPARRPGRGLQARRGGWGMDRVRGGGIGPPDGQGGGAGRSRRRSPRARPGGGGGGHVQGPPRRARRGAPSRGGRRRLWRARSCRGGGAGRRHRGGRRPVRGGRRASRRAPSWCRARASSSTTASWSTSTSSSTVPGIWAAGDVANAYHPLFETHIRLEHWSAALNQGPVAAKNMLGAARRLHEGPVLLLGPVRPRHGVQRVRHPLGPGRLPG